MNPSSARSQETKVRGAAQVRITHPRRVQATRAARKTVRSKDAARQSVNALSPVVHEVVEGFMDSLRSNGEGVLPIVLALQPELSTRGIAESDTEFAVRERRQSAAEKRFFRTIEAALRDAMGTILNCAARAAIKGGTELRRRRSAKDKTVMAADGRTSARKAHLLLPRANCSAD